jgi:hypothetical protein
MSRQEEDEEVLGVMLTESVVTLPHPAPVP